MTDAAPTFLPRPLRKLAGIALQRALNRAVSLDPETGLRLRALEGRSVQVHLAGPELTVRITVVDGALVVGPGEETSSLRVSASPGSLLAMAMRKNDDGVAPGKVDIAGDADLARRLEKLVGGYSPDVEEAFTGAFGDVIGVQVARAFRAAFAHGRERAAQFADDTAAWLRDETRVAVAPGEVDEFLDGVDALRERSDRLEARLARFERSHGKPAA